MGYHCIKIFLNAAFPYYHNFPAVFFQRLNMFIISFFCSFNFRIPIYLI